MRWSSRSVLVLCLLAAPVQAAELRVALGAFALAPGGVDVAFSVRPEGSRWAYGARYVRWVDTFSDPFTGNDLTETTNTLQGLSADWLFDPAAGDGWYLGVEVLRWAKAEHSLITGETGTDSVAAPFVGGGYRWAGQRVYWDLGMFIAPGAELSTSTSVSSEDDSGGFDIRLMVGIAF